MRVGGHIAASTQSVYELAVIGWDGSNPGSSVPVTVTVQGAGAGLMFLQQTYTYTQHENDHTAQYGQQVCVTLQASMLK